MSIAWTYRTPSVHFSREFGQVYRRASVARHAHFVGSFFLWTRTHRGQSPR
jgi:hypothetical protein